MMKKLRGHFGWCAVLACYAGALLLFLVLHFAGFVAQRVGFASGALAPAQFGIADFELEGLIQLDENTLVATSTDPQMFLLDEERRVCDVTLELAHALDPLQVEVLWAAPGKAHALQRTAVGLERDTRFLLVPGGGQALRIDPSAAVGDVITVKRIAVNEGWPFGAFFVPSAGEVCALVVLPGLLACVLSFVRQALAILRKKAVKPHG